VRVSPFQGSKEFMEGYQGRRAAAHAPALRPLAFESRPFGALLIGPDLVESKRKVGGSVHGKLIDREPLLTRGLLPRRWLAASFRRSDGL
jgi:hypothetical protein